MWYEWVWFEWRFPKNYHESVDLHLRRRQTMPTAVRRLERLSQRPWIGRGLATLEAGGKGSTPAMPPKRRFCIGVDVAAGAEQAPWTSQMPKDAKQQLQVWEVSLRKRVVDAPWVVIFFLQQFNSVSTNDDRIYHQKTTDDHKNNRITILLLAQLSLLLTVTHGHSDCHSDCHSYCHSYCHIFCHSSTQSSVCSCVRNVTND